MKTETIFYPEEYWRNSQLSIARYYGGCIINKEYVIVNKEGVSMRELADQAKIGDVLIPKGEPADLILVDWQPIYRALGRDAFIEHLKTNQYLKEARKYVKQLKAKKK
jgi:hypothetical protein